MFVFQASSYYNLAISHKCGDAMYRQAMLEIGGKVKANEGDASSMDLIRQSAELNHPKVRCQYYTTTVFYNA